MNLLLPLLIPVLCFWFGWRLGCSLSAVLCLSVLVHELSRLLLANASGEPPELSVLWPAGSLSTADSSRTRVVGAIAGLLSHLVICLMTSVPFYQSGQLRVALDPRNLEAFELGPEPLGNIVYLLFVVNWTLMVVNLLPFPPLAMGLVFKELAEKKLGKDAGAMIWLRGCWCLTTLLFLGGLALEVTLAVAIAALGMLSLMVRSRNATTFESEPRETFLGYDFSEGYTSLNRSHQSEKPTSLLQRWRAKREEIRRTREAELDLEVSENLDRILAQVHETGIDSLSSYDRKLLDSASERFRTRGALPGSSEVE
ncbi:MAG: M50 family metallopeptidase [Planctomycetaceae bacterium]|nr:M50 family metallopeptidase [Planctomycetaceae bacterium]